MKRNELHVIARKPNAYIWFRSGRQMHFFGPPGPPCEMEMKRIFLQAEWTCGLVH